MEHFFTGMFRLAQAHQISPAFISIRTLLRRRSDFVVGDWVMDSGAFRELELYGEWRISEEEYAAQIRRWRVCGNLMAAVAQDLMCETFMLERTGLTVSDHQRLTIERYDKLIRQDTGGVYIMPVLQGFTPESYVDHIDQYGPRLAQGAWVGVGSVCKRNGSPRQIRDVLMAIKLRRPDLRLHGFGVKRTSLADGFVRSLLWSADSMAWSFAARREGRDRNCWTEAAAYKQKVESQQPEYQAHLFV